MKIFNYKKEDIGARVRITSTVKWEDFDRKQQDIYFEVDKIFGNDLECNPHAFLTAAILPAMRYGEKRIAIEGEVCPELVEGLYCAMDIILSFYQFDLLPVKIEAKTKSYKNMTKKNERTASFLSGGIDSLATLRSNRIKFPSTHPGYIYDGFIVYGFDIGTMSNGNDLVAKDAFDGAVQSLSNIVDSIDNFTLIPVYTNIRSMEEDWPFWHYEFHGAALSAVAHAFDKRISCVYIASSYHIPRVHPLGSHPLLDPCYSSAELRVQHHNMRLSRLEKTKLVAEWDVALQNVRVCQTNPGGGLLNCGKCEKCIRTMLALTALGALNKSKAFPFDDVDEKLISTLSLRGKYNAKRYADLIPLLNEKGRYDLVRCINKIISRANNFGTIGLLDDERYKLQQIDRKHLNNAFIHMVGRLIALIVIKFEKLMTKIKISKR